MEPSTVALTFDYELFLGANHRPAQEVLLEPTRQLLATLESAGVRATFFIDLTYILRMRELANDPSSLARSDIGRLEQEQDDVIANIVSISHHGHELGLHLHPQWRDAIFSDGLWHFSTFDHYALHNLAEPETEKLFNEATALFHELHSLAAVHAPSMLSFRAGGWCIHPFDKLRELFVAHEIEIDSSVTVPFFRTPYSYPGRIPRPDRLLKQRSGWRFSDDPLIENNTGAFLEIPIDTVFVGLPDLMRMQSRVGPMDWHSRGSFVPGSGRLGKLLQRLGKLAHFGEQRMLTLDVTDVDAAYSQFQTYAGSFDNRKGFVFISHPKQFSQYSATMLEKLADRQPFCFRTMSEHAATLKADGDENK